MIRRHDLTDKIVMDRTRASQTMPKEHVTITPGEPIRPFRRHSWVLAVREGGLDNELGRSGEGREKPLPSLL